MKIKIQKMHENSVTQTYAHQGDAYFDLTAAIEAVLKAKKGGPA